MQNDTGKYYELSSFDIQLLFRLIRKHVKCKIMSRDVIAPNEVKRINIRNPVALHTLQCVLFVLING